MESAELIAILREARERVRARYPEGSAGASNIALPDLEPLVRARDAALGKVAAIGSVNPRPGGIVNSVVQAWKRLVARALDWHVREQTVFNRQAIACVDASIEALAEMNRAIAQLGDRLAAEEKLGEELKDIRSHWAGWRADWEHKLQQNEVQFLRGVADLQAAASHRADLMDANYRDALRAQHQDFTAALERTVMEIHRQVASDFERLRLDYDRMIHSELRLIRQRLAAAEGRKEAGTNAAVDDGRRWSAPDEAAASIPTLDYARFAERFRGPEDEVRAKQRIYLPHFEGKRNVLDIGCGRGEFLDLMREAGIPAHGIELSEESVAVCVQKGFDARRADLFQYLAALPEESLDGIFCSQVVEHIAPARLPEMVRLCASRLEPHGVIVFETPNPECLAIFSTYFYLDPTHQRPVPHQLLRFYLEEFGVGVLEVRRLSPAINAVPSLKDLPEDLRNSLFGGLDYALIGRKW